MLTPTEEEKDIKSQTDSEKNTDDEESSRFLFDPAYHFPSGIGDKEDDYGDESFP